jgi:hypothetical protein
MSAASGSSRPNFFDLLGLDPDAPWNQAEFERIVKEKRREWTKRSMLGVGPDALLAKRNLGLIGEINRVMNDPALREKEAEDRRRGRGRQNQALLDEFKEALRFAELKTYVLDSEISFWARTYAAIFPKGEADVRSHITVPIRVSKPKAAPRPQIDPVRAKEIREQLQILGQENLYTLLSQELHASFSEASSLLVLQQAADRLYSEQHRRADKTVEVTAKVKLAGHAKVIFGTEDERQRYQETLRQEKMAQSLKMFEKYCEGAQAIDATQSDIFLNEAKKQGWDSEEARERLVDLAARRRWPLTFSGAAAATRDERQRCVYCGELNRKDARFCKTCSHMLRMECPNCENDASLAEAACANCGFPVGDFYPIQEMLQTLVDKDGHLLASLDLNEAWEIADQLKRHWAPKKPDALARQIAEVWAEVQRRFDEQKRLIDQVAQLIAKRHFFAASDLLPKLPPTIQGMPDWQKQQQEIKERCEAANRQTSRAKQRGAREDEQERFYWSALQESADCAEAREGLKQITPKPPWDLTLKEDKNDTSVLLTWNPSLSPGVEHVVVRKAQSPPTALSDGEILVRIPAKQPKDAHAPGHYHDTTPPIGVSLFYAVFAQREGVPSSGSAQTPQSAFFLQEVTDLKPQIDNTSVTLKWTPPLNVHSITVVRKEGAAPQSPGDGVTLKPPAGQVNYLTDEAVQEGHRYFYTVYCHFLNSQGYLVTSNGSQTVMVTPEGPPDARKLNPTYTLRQGPIATWLDISWTQPEKGKVIILKSDQPLQLGPGNVLPEQDKNRYSEVPNEGKSDLWSEPGERYYVPAIIFNGNLYIGEEERYAYTKPITDLKAYNLVTSLALEWTWPENTDEVQIGYNTAGWLRDVQSAPKKITVSRQEYNLLQRYELKAPGGMDYYLIVAPVITTRQGKRVVGKGAQISCYLGPKIQIEYWFERGRSQHKLVLHARQSLIFPPLQIRTNSSTWQMTRTEGTFWHSLTLAAYPKTKWDIDLPSAYFPPHTYGRLFTKEEADENKIALIQTNPDRLRLS